VYGIGVQLIKLRIFGIEIVDYLDAKMPIHFSMELYLNVSNFNNVGVDIKRIEVDVYTADGDHIGSARQIYNIFIPSYCFVKEEFLAFQLLPLEQA